MHVALAELDVVQRDVREAEVGQCHGFTAHVVEIARQRQRALGVLERDVVFAGLQEEVGHVREQADFVELRLGAARVIECELERAALALRVAEPVEDDAQRVLAA